MGMNGITVMKINDLTVGRVSGESFGYRNSLRLTVDIRVESLNRQDAYSTTDHRKLTTRPLSFALSWGIWTGQHMVSGGQLDPSELTVTKYADGMTPAMLSGLINLHKRYHLNYMQAGCIHQNGAGTECPAGYRYGSAWLVEELPAGFMDALRSCLPPVPIQHAT
jgi:hypothetical protein